MAGEAPSKQDLVAVFKRLRSIPTNKICFDCGTNNPTWSSVTFGVFICIDCSAVHRSLGVHLSFVRSTQLDSWTWLQLRAMQCGGNANATAFFQQHNCSTTDAQQKYKSRAAVLYREKLHHLAAAAMRNYGNELHLDIGHNEHSASPTKKEVDFFQEHSEAALFSNNIQDYNSEPVQNGNMINYGNNNSEGPNVEAALSTSPTQAIKTQEVRKSTIGCRKPPQSKKSGLATKKGLGAQRVKKDFSEIEKEAELADQRKEEYEINKKIEQKLSEEQAAKQMASVRLAYKDLSEEREKQEQRWKKADPKKAEQFERLGMGFSGRAKVSHSIASDMQTIASEEIPTSKSSRRREDHYDKRDSFEEEFEFLGLTSGPSKFSDSGFSSRKEDSYSSYKTENKSYSSFDDSDNNRRSTKANIPSVNNSDVAQKKFGNAKAISSDQYFGDSRNNDYERQANLAKFQGSSSISSADYFGEPQKIPNRNYDFNAPNLADIKDGVKDGVTRVAGRLSNIASGVMSSFQDRYGH